jgi:cytochrome P450
VQHLVPDHCPQSANARRGTRLRHRTASTSHSHTVARRGRQGSHVADFARPLPFTVINDVLGVPPDDRHWLGEALAVLNRGFASQRDSDRTAVQAANDWPSRCSATSLGCSTSEPQNQPMTS